MDIGVFSFLVNVSLLGMPLYLVQVYDPFLPSPSYETLIYLSINAVRSLGFMMVLEVVKSVCSNWVAPGMDVRIGELAMIRTSVASRDERVG